MNRDILLQHFDRISEAPNAIPRLRRFILDLAVRGKLVEQDPNDEPSGELLKRKEVTRTSDVPENWLSAKIGQLMAFQYGKAFPAVDRNDQGSVAVFGSNGIVGYCEIALAEEPAIIIGRKGSAGALNLSNGPSWTTDVAYFLIPPDFFDIRFLYIALQVLDLGSLGKGVKPGLSRSEAYQFPIVIPPLAEQNRIIAKVDELMSLCNQLEAERNKRERRRDRLVASSLNRISTTTAEEANDATRFHLNHLPRLTTRTEHIKQLRQTILNLAVRGRLVSQDTNDEPAAELLKRIQVEKIRLVKEGQIRKEKELPPVSEEEMICALPLHWKWSRLRSLVFILGDGLHGTPTYDDGTEYYFINGNNLVDGKIVIKSNTKTVSYSELQKHKKPMTLNTVLVSINGTLGNVAFYNNEEVLLGKSACFFDLSECIDKQFIKRVIESPYFIDYARQSATGATIMNLSLKAMNELPVALPPLAEQHRIVAKVDELMTLCDQLETQITTTEADSRRLLEAVLRDALANTAQGTANAAA